MSNIYDMSGKKKVIFTENLETNITYKEIMKIVIENAEIFVSNLYQNITKKYDVGINMCPSDIFGSEKIDKQKEEDICNYESIGCTKCWTNAIKGLEEKIK